MASQVAADQRGAFTIPVVEAPVSPPSEATWPELAQPDHAHEAAHITAPAASREAAAAQRAHASTPATVEVTGSKILLASGVAVGVTTLITAGLMRRRAMPAVREMAAGVLEIRIPLWLPVALVGIGREVLTYRRALAEAKAAMQPPS